MPYKVIDIYKDLPKTNCSECGKPGCFAFATAVFVEGLPIDKCPYLEPEKLEQMRSRLAEQKQSEGSGKKAKSENALYFLREKLGEADLSELSEKAGGKYSSDQGREQVDLDFLNQPHRITKEDVVALAGEYPTVWVKIFLLIYLTRASGGPSKGQWIAFRQLPNTASKAKSFDECADKIAEAFSGRGDQLDNACKHLGGRQLDHESADRAWYFRILPKVGMQLLFWDAEEDFGARVSLLLDAGVLDYLDQEAVVFMAEAFEKRLQGQGLEEVIP